MSLAKVLKLGALLLVFIAGNAGYFVWRAQALERGFRLMHPDESEARLLEVVGQPSEIRGCDEGLRQIVKRDEPGARQCAKVYWYSAWPFPDDGWLLPIDDTGVIMQIDRKGLP